LILFNASLTDQDRRKSEYVMMILHDLKEPIATVHNCMQLVLGGFCGEVDVKAKQTLSRGSNWLQKMILLTHDLLSLSRMKILPPVDLKPILLNKEIDKVLVEQKGIFVGKSLQTHFSLPEEPVWIRGDVEIFSHIFTNLISNAVKYTPAGGLIGVNLTVDNKYVKLEVWDTGIGIPPQYQQKVFEDFFRTPEAIEIDQQGTGLGLAIIKHGVEVFNGSIKISSPHDKAPDLHQGTCFCIEFPAA
jgi:signal transduction histidine kinase